MNASYWLGVATPLVVGVLGYALMWVVVQGCWALGQRGWFVETGPAPKSKVDWFSRLHVRGRWGFYYGVYRVHDEYRPGWGSRWVAIGPVTVGHKSTRLGLEHKPAPHERTDRKESR